MCECRECRNTGEYREVYSRIHHGKYMDDVTIVDADRIVPIIRTESVLDIDDLRICREIIVDNPSSSIDNRKSTIGDIDPCLGSSRIGHIVRNKEDIITISIVFSIRHHRIIIREYDYYRSVDVCVHEIRCDDTILDDMNPPESFFLYYYFPLLYLLIVLPLQPREYRSREKYSEDSVDRDHISTCDRYDHIDLIWCKEDLVCDDLTNWLDPRIYLTRLIYRTLGVYLCNDTILQIVPIGDLYDLSDSYLARHDISSTIEKRSNTDRVLERDDRIIKIQKISF